MSSILPQASRYANSRHSYSFPRISGFLFDGSQSYDFGNDGEGQTLGGCSVRVHLSSEKYGSIFNLSQANVRRTNVATKLKVTYVKGSFLDVKVQYKACRLALKIYHKSTTELSLFRGRLVGLLLRREHYTTQQRLPRFQRNDRRRL